MKINEMIRERRIAKKLTQEQMAGYLGVTAPAVNKWEKGTSYPDITLLPALARLLDTDLNTLLSFQEDLSDREIALFLNELSELSEKEGVETLYVRALDSSDSAIQNQAKAMLISRYMGRKEYERAQELLNSLPEQDFFDKKQIQVNLLIELGLMGVQFICSPFSTLSGHQTAQKGFKNTRFDVKVTHTQIGNQSIAIVQTY